MRPVRVTLTAAGVSPWIPLNRLQNSFAVALACIPSYNANLTYSVQHTFDEVTWQDAHSISISRSGTTATVTDTGPAGLGHGLSTNDSVIIKGSGSGNLDSPTAAFASGATGDQGVTITVTGVNTYTYTVANSGATADGGSAKALGLRVYNCDLATLVGATTRLDGNYAFPPTAIRMNITSFTAGTLDMLVNQGQGA